MILVTLWESWGTLINMGFESHFSFSDFAHEARLCSNLNKNLPAKNLSLRAELDIMRRLPKIVSSQE